jgi:glycine cleavage system H lipoate-binding protein
MLNEQPYAVWLFKIKAASEDTLRADLEALMPLEKYSSSAGA